MAFTDNTSSVVLYSFIALIIFLISLGVKFKLKSKYRLEKYRVYTHNKVNIGNLILANDVCDFLLTW